MSYNSGSNRARNFKSASRFSLVRFWNYSPWIVLHSIQLLLLIKIELNYVNRMHLCENVFCSTVIFQIQQNVSPLKLNLCVGIVLFIRVIHLKARTVPVLCATIFLRPILNNGFIVHFVIIIIGNLVHGQYKIKSWCLCEWR